jgi:hypothetical protein
MVSEEEKYQKSSEMIDVAMHEGTEDTPYPWELQVNLEMAGPITRLASRSHSFESEFSPDRR